MLAGTGWGEPNVRLCDSENCCLLLLGQGLCGAILGRVLGLVLLGLGESRLGIRVCGVLVRFC